MNIALGSPLVSASVAAAYANILRGCGIPAGVKNRPLPMGLLAQRLHIEDDFPRVSPRDVSLHRRHPGLRAAVPHLVEHHPVRIPGRPPSVAQITWTMIGIG